MARAQNATNVSGAISNRLTGHCRRLWVRCDSASAQPVRVRVRNRDKVSASGSIHGPADYTQLEAGDERVFDGSTENPIETLHLYTAGVSGQASWSVVG